MKADDAEDINQVIKIHEMPAVTLRKVETFDVVAEDTEEVEATPLNDNAGWTSCNITTDSFFSCYDCHTRVFCLPIGGRMKPCGPFKPFCNYGFCTHFPSAECSITSTEATNDTTPIKIE